MLRDVILHRFTKVNNTDVGGVLQRIYTNNRGDGVVITRLTKVSDSSECDDGDTVTPFCTSFTKKGDDNNFHYSDLRRSDKVRTYRNIRTYLAWHGHMNFGGKRGNCNHSSLFMSQTTATKSNDHSFLTSRTSAGGKGERYTH